MPQLDVLDFINSSWEALPFLQNGRGLAKCLEKGEEMREGKQWLVCKMNKKNWGTERSLKY